MLPPVADFWSTLPEIFNWLAGDLDAPQPTPIEPGSVDTVVRSRVLPVSMPARSRAPLEIIRFAAANHLCVTLAYHGSMRQIEPYSLRRTAAGNFVLHATRSDSGQPRSYRVDQIHGATVTGRSFVPRYRIELSSEGPMFIAPSAASVGIGRGPARISRSSPRPRRAVSLQRSSAVYVY